VIAIVSRSNFAQRGASQRTGHDSEQKQRDAARGRCFDGVKVAQSHAAERRDDEQLSHDRGNPCVAARVAYSPLRSPM